MRFAAFLLVCAAAYVVLAALAASADFLTYDEGNFLTYGLQHLRGPVVRDQALNSKLPVTALHALPVLLDGRSALTLFPDGTARLAPWALALARVPAIALGALLVVAIGLGARSLVGTRAGQASALFAALEPNLLAHGHLVTADGGATLATLLSALATFRFVRTKRLADAALLGGALGLCLLCKFMLLAWVLLVVGVVLATRAANGRSLAVAALACILVVDAGFAFRGVPGHLPAHPRSHKVSLAAMALDRAPLPVPEDWLLGLDWTAGDEESGRGFGNLYLGGELQEGPERRGWASYYLVGLALKLPLPVIVLAVLGLRRHGRELLAPRFLALGWLVFVSVFNRAQLGIRHALPVVPLLLLEAGSGYAWLEARRPRVARALVIWLAASVLSFAPDFLPYTNELIVDRTLAHRRIADSNLDWGQADGAAREFLAKNPDVVFMPGAPVRSRVLVSVNALVGITAPRERYAWLRERAPEGHVRHAYLVFDAR